MSKITHTTPPSTQKHGSPRPYIIGFLLSVLCTLVPYQLVVNETLKGTALLAALLGFAVVQLVIQLMFFLHLGREKKPRFNLFFLVSTLVIILVVVGGSIWIMNHLHYNMAEKDVADKVSTDEAVYQVGGQQVGTCPKLGANHTIELKNNAAHPRQVTARVCDTLTIINLDGAARTLIFSAYEQYQTYTGESGQTIRSGRNTVITLTKSGVHTFYDHELTAISGSFTVLP